MYPFIVRVVFISGFITGVLIGVLVLSYTSKTVKYSAKRDGEAYVGTGSSSASYNRWFESTHLCRTNVSLDYLRYSNRSFTLESDYLYDKVKVYCIVLVRKPKNAKSVNATWSKHCNQAAFVNLPIKTPASKIQLPIKPVKINSSWPILCNALREVPLAYNWTVVVNDDMFVLVENLRYKVASLNDSLGHYLGHPIKFWSTIYNVAEAGYVLSRGTVKVFQGKFTSHSECVSAGRFWNQEDFYLGKHLGDLNIFPTDTRDENGLSTFHGYNLAKLLFPGSLKTFSNYYKSSVYPTSCCSPDSITFQAIEGDKMYTYHYLLYQLQIFYFGSLGNRPASVPKEEVWITFLRSRGIFRDTLSAKEYYKIWEDLVHDPLVFNQRLSKFEKHASEA